MGELWVAVTEEWQAVAMRRSSPMLQGAGRRLGVVEALSVKRATCQGHPVPGSAAFRRGPLHRMDWRSDWEECKRRPPVGAGAAASSGDNGDSGRKQQMTKVGGSAAGSRPLERGDTANGDGVKEGLAWEVNGGGSCCCSERGTVGAVGPDSQWERGCMPPCHWCRHPCQVWSAVRERPFYGKQQKENQTRKPCTMKPLCRIGDRCCLEGLRCAHKCRTAHQ